MSSEDNHIRIFDTTLRDGEQSPGATMTLDEKIQVAELLDDMGAVSYTHLTLPTICSV